MNHLKKNWFVDDFLHGNLIFFICVNGAPGWAPSQSSPTCHRCGSRCNHDENCLKGWEISLATVVTCPLSLEPHFQVVLQELDRHTMCFFWCFLGPKLT